MMQELKTDPEFESLLPPLSETEFNELEKAVLDIGRVVYPIVVWNDTIIDGHYRYRILQKNPDIPYTVVSCDFASKDEAIECIYGLQISHRSLNKSMAKYIVGKKYELSKKSIGYNELIVQIEQNSRVDQNDPPKSHGSRTTVAQETGTNEAYVQRAYCFTLAVDGAEKVIPGIRELILHEQVMASREELDAVCRASPDDAVWILEELNKPKAERIRLAQMVNALVKKEKKQPPSPARNNSPPPLPRQPMGRNGHSVCLPIRPEDSVPPPRIEKPESGDITQSSQAAVSEANLHIIPGFSDKQNGQDDTSLPPVAEAAEGHQVLTITGRPIEESVLDSLHCAVVSLMQTCNNLFNRYPALLSSEQYRQRSIDTIEEFNSYIKQIKKGYRKQ